MVVTTGVFVGAVDAVGVVWLEDGKELGVNGAVDVEGYAVPVFGCLR